ncbi:MAG: hypothetical protein AAFU60_13820, partial [Bacteroidota bacterium]
WGFIFPVLGILLFFSNGYILAAIGSGLGLALITYLIWKAPNGESPVTQLKQPIPTNREVPVSQSAVSSQSVVEQKAPEVYTNDAVSKKDKTLGEMTDEERQAYFQQYMPKSAKEV